MPVSKCLSGSTWPESCAICWPTPAVVKGALSYSRVAAASWATAAVTGIPAVYRSNGIVPEDSQRRSASYCSVVSVRRSRLGGGRTILTSPESPLDFELIREPGKIVTRNCKAGRDTDFGRFLSDGSARGIEPLHGSGRVGLVPRPREGSAPRIRSRRSRRSRRCRG
jgi:hypothetical protein